MAEDIREIPVEGEDTLAIINENFGILINRIQKVNRFISNLDALRIQQVYNYNPNTGKHDVNNKIDITDFITTCWSKLSVYHGVYCNLGSDYSFTFNGEDVKNGDFLIKLPDNTFIIIPGSTPYYYQPTDYSTSTGILTFTLMSATPAATTATVTVPNWAKGSDVGRIKHATFSPTNIINLSPPVPQSYEIKAGRYFINGEELVFSPTHITVAGVQVTLPTDIDEYYIPYIEV